MLLPFLLRSTGSSRMSGWLLWTTGTPLRVVEGFRPMVAQWEKNTSPVQQRLYAYLDGLMTQLGPLTTSHSQNLFLDLEVDVENASRLERYYDLENYLTPLFGRRWIDPAAFVLVRATKRVGGGSRLVVGEAKSSGDSSVHPGWGHFSCTIIRSVSSKEWKNEVKVALTAQVLTPLPAGPVEIVLAWRCSPKRNWVSLWKPTGDSMGSGGLVPRRLKGQYGTGGSDAM